MARSLTGHHAEVKYQCTIEQLYDKATSAVQLNGSIGDRRMVQNNSRSKARISIASHSFQHFSLTDHV